MDKKINTFYWPVYLKLKCLYRLNYKYHDQNKKINLNKNINQNLYTDTSDDNQVVKNIIEEHKKKKIRRKKEKMK